MNRSLQALARARRVLSHVSLTSAAAGRRAALHSAATSPLSASASSAAAAASGAGAAAAPSGAAGAGGGARSVVRAFAGVPRYATPRAMYEHLLALTAAPADAPGATVVVRNFVGTIESMAAADLTIATELFPADALSFYTRHNLLQTDPTASAEDRALYQKYYSAARGGGQGDYRHLIREKLANVVDALTRFPHSKRAVLTVPFPTKAAAFRADDDGARASALPLHSHTDEQKCLRELHFHLQPRDTPLTGAGAAAGTGELVLCCTGVMRAQAVSIFPKNIHFIGSVMHLVGSRLSRPVGTYTQLTTTLVAER